MSPWVRLDENAIDHPKVLKLSDGAFRLWVESLAHCQRFLTDGVVQTSSLRGLRNYSPKRRETIISAGLWDATDTGIQIHDYLQWNESKEQVLFARECAQRRVALLRDPELRQQIRARDGNECRYCGRTVHWNDRKGDLGGTYDHIDPYKGNTFENLVVCCRGCNSSKGRRTPQEAGLTLIPIKPVSRLNLDRISAPTSGVVCMSSGSEVKERGLGETVEARAGAFAEWYAETHERLFHVGYFGTNSDWLKVLELCKKFSDQELQDAAIVWFGHEDDFATNGTRTIAKFASRVTGCIQQARARGIA